MNSVTEQSFLSDVSHHQLTIVKDDGLYRHLRLKAPKTNNQYFDIVTWPGYLCFSGDMGCYTFSRVEDMFSFFRTEGDDLYIKPRYWSEKLQAVCRTDGFKKFSWDRFENNLMDYCESEGQKQWMREEIRFIEHDEFGAVGFVREFDNDNDANVDLSDFFECTTDIFTDRFIWCCYALNWAVGLYDKLKRPEAA